jgi:hypothetical protein
MQLTHEMQSLQSQLTTHSNTIQNLQLANQQLSYEIKELQKPPNYDILFEYINRQNSIIQSDLERSLSFKYDKKDIETLLPKKTEEMYLQLKSQVNEVIYDLKQDYLNKGQLLDIFATKVSFLTACLL